MRGCREVTILSTPNLFSGFHRLAVGAHRGQASKWPARRAGATHNMSCRVHSYSVPMGCTRVHAASLGGACAGHTVYGAMRLCSPFLKPLARLGSITPFCWCAGHVAHMCMHRPHFSSTNPQPALCFFLSGLCLSLEPAALVAAAALARDAEATLL